MTSSKSSNANISESSIGGDHSCFSGLQFIIFKKTFGVDVFGCVLSYDKDYPIPITTKVINKAYDIQLGHANMKHCFQFQPIIEKQ